MKRSAWSFRIPVIIAGLLVSYLTAVEALSRALENRAPQVALRVAPFNQAARASSAAALLETSGSPDDVRRAEALAKRALATEPVNVAALRTLALAASFENEKDKARAYFSDISRLTRRDLASHLWWIEQKVAEGDVAGVLMHYDEALKTSRRAQDLLLPIMTQASADPIIAAKLIPLLERRPEYFRQFFIQMTDSATDTSGAAQLGRAVLDRDSPDDQDMINRIIMRFGRDGAFGPAREMFAWATRGQHNGNIVDGNFDDPTPFTLFDWELTVGDNLTAEIAPRGGGESLYLIARVARGLAARQLLNLKSGRYLFKATVGDVPKAKVDRPTLGLTCATGLETILAPLTFPEAPDSQAKLEAVFEVRPDCRFQWLGLTASAVNQDDVQVWIDDISITRTR